MSLDDQCISDGGIWCVAASAWEDGVSRMLLVLLMLLAGVIIGMIVLRGLRAVQSFTASRKGDL